MKRFVMCLVAASLTTACTAKSVMVARPADRQADTAVTTLWANEIARVAQDGDWILTRSYSAISDVIVLSTTGEELSHASIYDAKTQTVIESIDTGVREIPLAQLLQRNHYAIVVRPSKMTAADKAHSLVRARSKLGAAYDERGLFGFDNPDAFYCSELVWWASQTAARTGEYHSVITPSELMKYGEVVYWSGKRDDAQVMELARERVARR